MSQGSFYVFDLIYSGSMECLLTDILLLDATLTWGKKYGLLKVNNS